MVCFPSILCGEASTSRLPGINPAGYVSHTGYQYDSISRVAGHREEAPPSKFSNEGGLRKSVFRGIGILIILTFRYFRRGLDSGYHLLTFWRPWGPAPTTRK